MSKAAGLYDLLKEQEQSEGSFDAGLSLEQWRELGMNGVAIPMSIPLHGTSMKPLIRPEKDTVTIVPLAREPMVGDIVLFRRSDGKNIVHRVYKVFPDGLQTWGDNCLLPDAPIKREDVYGLVVSMEKKGKTYALDTDRQRACGLRWMKYGRPVWMALRRIRAFGGRMIRPVCPGFHKDQSSGRY